MVARASHQHATPWHPSHSHRFRNVRRAAVSSRNCAATGTAKPRHSSTQTPAWRQAQPPSAAAVGPARLLPLAAGTSCSRQLAPPDGWPGTGAAWVSRRAQRARLAKRARAPGPEKAGEAQTSGSAARATSSRLAACTSTNQRKGRRHSQGSVFTPCRDGRGAGTNPAVRVGCSVCDRDDQPTTGAHRQRLATADKRSCNWHKASPGLRSEARIAPTRPSCLRAWLRGASAAAPSAVAAQPLRAGRMPG